MLLQKEVSMARSRRKYTREFKVEALKLVLEEGRRGWRSASIAWLVS